jgi:hypothetical protein
MSMNKDKLCIRMQLKQMTYSSCMAGTFEQQSVGTWNDTCIGFPDFLQHVSYFELLAEPFKGSGPMSDMMRWRSIPKSLKGLVVLSILHKIQGHVGTRSSTCHWTCG